MTSGLLSDASELYLRIFYSAMVVWSLSGILKMITILYTNFNMKKTAKTDLLFQSNPALPFSSFFVGLKNLCRYFIFLLDKKYLIVYIPIKE